MKKIMILTLFVFGAAAAKAQNKEKEFKKFKVDVNLGYAIPQGSGAKGGGIFAIEPKFALVDQFALGLRMEGAAMARATTDESGYVKTSEVKANGSYLVTGDYYFNNNNFRPFAGAGTGLYVAAGTDEELTMEGKIETGNKFGFMLRGGFELGHFRTGLEYNFVGKTGKIQNGYFGIKVGAIIGGGRLN